MGGWGSGSRSQRSCVEDALTIDLPRMIRSGRIRDGFRGDGKICFAHGKEPLLLVKFFYDLIDPEFAWLDLQFRCDALKPAYPVVDQMIRLLHTVPHYGGRHWWMRCPDTGKRLSKLYLPIGGAKFASRETWQLVYESQRADLHGRAFDRLKKLQRKLGCEERWGAVPDRPKGMWQKTFQAYMAEFHEREARCGQETEAIMVPLRKRAE